MANRFRGEITARADGIEYKLRMDFNAMGSFETQTGMNALDWSEKAEAGEASVNDMITMVHCCLERHHGDAPRQVAGDIISEDTDTLTRLFQASAPDPTGQPAGK